MGSICSSSNNSPSRRSRSRSSHASRPRPRIAATATPTGAADANRDRNDANRNVNRGDRGWRQGGGNDRRPGYNGPRRDYSGFRDYHRGYNSSRRFRGPEYRRPSGWYDRRWSFGEFLPGLFWSSSYWLNDFNRYDLPPPPYGTVWVRNGRDALLVDRDTGEIISVRYSVFY